MAASGAGSPCGACKFLRRKCTSDCVFAPYFCFEQAPAQFAAIHKIFGASNVSKLLLHVPAHDRCEAVVTIAYEAQARIKDPVYGCVAHIFALQQQVAILQAQLMQVKAQIASGAIARSRLMEDHHQWQGSINNSFLQSYSTLEQPMHPNRSLDRMDYFSNEFSMQERDYKEDDLSNQCTKKVATHEYLEELQAMAMRMTRSL